MKYYILQTTKNKRSVYFQDLTVNGIPCDTNNRDLARKMTYETAVFYAANFNSAISACERINNAIYPKYKVVEL